MSASSSTCSTGLRVFLKRSAQSSSNLARVIVSWKSMPSAIPSMVILTWWTEERSLLAFSTSDLSF